MQGKDLDLIVGTHLTTLGLTLLISLLKQYVYLPSFAAVSA